MLHRSFLTTFTRRVFSTNNATGSLVLWHNPECSKSRAAKALLEERGEQFETRMYMENPPSFSELKVLQKQLSLPPIEWSRTNDDTWLEHFDNATIYDDFLPDDADILRAMETFPIMIERPILVQGDIAVIGRPTDNILSLLDGDSTSTSSAIAEEATVLAHLSALDIAAKSAVSRGVSSDILERTLMRMTAELHMLQ